MANKRFISKSILGTDRFLELSHENKILYCYLVLEADDDGFVGNTKTVLAMLDMKEEQLNELEKEQLIIRFGKKVVVIKHWYHHNKVPADRYTGTLFVDERKRLTIVDRTYVLECDPATKKN